MRKRVLKNQKKQLKKSNRDDKSYDLPKPFFEHVQELRQRSLYIVLFFIASSIIGYFLRDFLLQLLLKPLNQPIYYTSVAGGLDISLKISFFFGGILTIPLFMYQIFKFSEPLLPAFVKKRIILYSLFSLCLIGVGIVFAYLVLLPSALRFLSLFTSDQVLSLLSSDQYISFVMRYVIGGALIFQLPIILLLYNALSPLSSKKLIHYIKYVILISFILAAIITPTPDVLNQILVAVPIIALYLLSILLINIINSSRQSLDKALQRRVI